MIGQGLQSPVVSGIERLVGQYDLLFGVKFAGAGDDQTDDFRVQFKHGGQ